MEIDISPCVPSAFGAGYWAKFRNFGIESIPTLQGVPKRTSLLDDSAYREFWLEVFRTDHPELKDLGLKSRLNSFFATESLDDARRYISRSGFQGQSRIFKIQASDTGLKLDMTWLDQKFPRDFKKFGYYYLRYWKGLMMEDDAHLAGHEKRGSLIEVLLDGGVKIGEAIS